MKHSITHIDLIASSTCNLNCDFCYLYKNKAFHSFNKSIMDAWENGTYIDNVEKVLLKLQSDPLDVHKIFLWGGEPTLGFKWIYPEIPHLFNKFPNITTFYFATNFTTELNYFKEFLNSIEANTNYNIDLRIQLSIDGPDKCAETGHKGTEQIYKQNFDKLANIFKNIKFNKIRYVGITLHPTVNSKIFFKYFNKYSNISNYFNYFNNLATYGYSVLSEATSITKPKIKIAYNLPYPSLPTNCSVKDGIVYNKIVVSIDKYLQENPNEFVNNKHNINDNLTMPNKQCIQWVSEFLILPDGSIPLCNGFYLNHLKDYITEAVETNDKDILNFCNVSEDFAFNPLEMNDKELEELDWYAFEGCKSNLTTKMYFKKAIIQELAKSNQIPSRFISDNEAFAYAHLISGTNTCERTNGSSSGLTFIPTVSFARRAFNGAAQYLIEKEISEKKSNF